MIAGGELGTVTHARFRLFSDYAAHPEGALTWRYERERGGSGVARATSRPTASTSPVTCWATSRPWSPTARSSSPSGPARRAPRPGTRARPAASSGPVENEDYVAALLRFASGARGVLEASRVAVGEQNNYGFEVHGTRGAVFWDFRRMNELGVSAGGDVRRTSP